MSRNSGSFTGSFFFADLRRSKRYELAETPFFRLSQKKIRTAQKEPLFRDM